MLRNLAGRKNMKVMETYIISSPTSDYGESAHGGELVAARGVRDLQDDIPLAPTNDFPVIGFSHKKSKYERLIIFAATTCMYPPLLLYRIRRRNHL